MTPCLGALGSSFAEVGHAFASVGTHLDFHFQDLQGADTVIYERLAASGKEHCDATMAHLEDYGNQGLRTLCLAYRCAGHNVADPGRFVDFGIR